MVGLWSATPFTITLLYRIEQGDLYIVIGDTRKVSLWPQPRSEPPFIPRVSIAEMQKNEISQ